MICDTPITVIKAGECIKGKLYPEDVKVPCGKCPNCKIRRVQQWAHRLLTEDKRSISSHFITLTYDTEHVPLTRGAFPMTLNKKHVSEFVKRLRNYQSVKLKYYAAGEYGTRHNRPHYHIIMFNLTNIENVAKAWTYGAVHIGNVSGNSVAYTAKYIDKDKKVPLHQNDFREKEFSLMSKNLGDNYITEKVKKWHKEDLQRMYIVLEGGNKIPISRYYRNKILNEDERHKQLHIIQKHMSDTDIKKERYYNDKPQTKTYDESKREGKQSRYDKFKKQIKNRENEHF